MADVTHPQPAVAADAVSMPWLVIVRWTAIAAGIGALAAGSNLGTPRNITGAVVLLAIAVVSNLWLTWRIRRAPAPDTAVGGWLVAFDVVTLSWILHESGGVLNPVSIFYLVHIVLAALVLGRGWSWAIALLSIVGYGVLFLWQPGALTAAGAMHPEIGMHVRGMWLAFAPTALIVAVLVARLAAMIERRDRALESWREPTARDARLGSLATLSAGAAHELSTPLATIAVASRELDRALSSVPDANQAREDVRLIRAEVDRCRRVLDDMAARISEPMGEMPTEATATVVAERALLELSADERSRVDVSAPDTLVVSWPNRVVTRAIVNLLRNALQASSRGERVSLRLTALAKASVRLEVIDTGVGMAAAIRTRAGEPFFTTRLEGTGMGLGLFVTRAAVDQMRGTLHIDSIEGRGTTATIVLPARVGGAEHE